jgi:NADPH:quinone reductase-like Zn-dependent oxidoreductase
MESSIVSSSEPSSATPATAERTMKAIVYERYGPPNVLELREVDLPVIEDHQVLVRVRASSINAAEWYEVNGPLFVRLAGFGNGLRRPKNTGVGSDLAGVVEAVGKDVKEFQPGDEVFGTALGAWAEYARSREPRLVRKPANVSFEEAAAVPIAGITALQALRDHGHVQPGQKVLVNGASGGVGTYAVQIAKALGAEVTAVCRTRNVEQARLLGADHVVDYTQEDFTRRGVRHDLLLDIAGSRRLSELRRALTREATIVLVGAKMKASGLGPLPHVAATRLAAIGRSQTMKFFVAKIEKEALEFLGELLESGKMRSAIDRSYELSQARDAFSYLGEGHARGKVVLTM